tara:strand:+ start:1483 stop:1908 length:426 start_codon:yes stop_codon:yes gene_type:complete
MPEVFHLLRVQQQYLTMKPPTANTMFLTFKKRETAYKCKEYIEYHRNKYGTWPSLNMDTDYEKIVYEMDRINSTDPIYIDKKSIGDIENIMHCSGTGVMYCYEFDMAPVRNSFTITFRAQEMEIELDLDKYLQSLQNTLDL